MNPFQKISSAKKSLEEVLSVLPSGYFWTTIIKFIVYLLGRCNDSLTQGSFDSVPELKAIDLQIDSLFDELQAPESE